MIEHECPTEQPESDASAAPATASQAPTLPLQQRSVQGTLGFVGMVALAALLWSGRDVLWRTQPPARPAQPTQILLQIDINTAPVNELAVLPNVGPVLAARIVFERQRGGPFSSVQDLARVRGIGQKTIAQIDLFCVVDNGPDSLVALSDKQTN